MILRATSDFAQGAFVVRKGATLAVTQEVGAWLMDSWPAAFEVVPDAPSAPVEVKQAAPVADKQAKPLKRK